MPFSLFFVNVFLQLKITGITSSIINELPIYPESYPLFLSVHFSSLFGAYCV